MSGLPYRRYPCARDRSSHGCPFRRDTEPGEFPDYRYDALRATAGGPGCEAPLGAPVFACHKTDEGQEQACAGWLAVSGYWHLGIRLAIAMKQLPVGVLEPGEGWPELFSSYEEMAEAQGHSPDEMRH